MRKTILILAILLCFTSVKPIGSNREYKQPAVMVLKRLNTSLDKLKYEIHNNDSCAVVSDVVRDIQEIK